MRSKSASRRQALSRTLRARYGSSPNLSNASVLGAGRSDLTNALRRREIPAPQAWVCRHCRRAEFGNRPCPTIENHSGDCTCACGLTQLESLRATRKARSP